jgi:phosphate starvation-inducible PhoH-like protein
MLTTRGILMSNNAARYQQRTEGSTRKNTRKEKAAVACDAGTLAEVKEKYRQERLERVQKLSPKNEHQAETIEAFKDKQLIIQSGSAGVGKTELACWWASKLWLEGKIDTIVITRPHKHLGDDYGAVKGSDAEKLLPFCMSILMKLRKHLGVGTLRNNFKMDRLDDLFGDAKGIIIVPIEKIQGLSYDSRTIIIGDEIQSASVSQVKALATRMEEGCQLQEELLWLKVLKYFRIRRGGHMMRLINYDIIKVLGVKLRHMIVITYSLNRCEENFFVGVLYSAMIKTHVIFAFK